MGKREKYKVTTITREELKAKMDRGDDFVLLEVLGEASYRRAHLPGAIRFQDHGSGHRALAGQERGDRRLLLELQLTLLDAGRP